MSRGFDYRRIDGTTVPLTGEIISNTAFATRRYPIRRTVPPPIRLGWLEVADVGQLLLQIVGDTHTRHTVHMRTQTSFSLNR